MGTLSIQRNAGDGRLAQSVAVQAKSGGLVWPAGMVLRLPAAQDSFGIALEIAEERRDRREQLPW